MPLADEEGCATCRATRQWCADPYHASSFDEDDLRAELAEMDEGRRSAITLWQMAVRSQSTPPNRTALAAIIAEKMGHERSDDSPTCMDEDATLGCRHDGGHPAEPGCDTCGEYGWPCAPALAAADAVLAAAHVVGCGCQMDASGSVFVDRCVCPPEREARRHELKTWPEHFREVKAGRKTFELRRDDRGGYRVGDVLVLREWDPASHRYTGQKCVRLVRHVLHGGQFGLAEGYVCMSLGGA